MDVFEALGNATRRALLRRLAASPARVVDLSGEHAMSRPAISKHLRLLREAGLVTPQPQGRETWYHLRAAALDGVRALVNDLASAASASAPPVTAIDLDALDLEVRRTVRDHRKAAHGTNRHDPPAQRLAAPGA